MTERATESPEPSPSPPGLTLLTHDGRPYRFDPGALCLELLTTGGPGAFARWEVLHAPADLVAWAGRSRLPDGLDLAVVPADVERARALRDALFLLAADRAHGRPLRPGHLDIVNAAAAEPPLVTRVEPDGTRGWAPGATGPRLLSTVARDAIELLTGPWGGRLRECAAPDCAFLFLDASRPGRRRWCAMNRCGNRQHVREHRSRRQRDTPPAR
jgi:predicted RNA-binding Zn ribbon-like protein